MKRLFPAAIIFVLTILLCIYSNTTINRQCDKTMQDINKFYNGQITAETVKTNWNTRKEKMLLFVNHDFLDEISIYVGQLTANTKDEYSIIIYKNIQTILSMIKDEQRLSAHSFY